jgi:hypothetical protein
MYVNSEVRSQPACDFFQLHGLSSLQDFRVPCPFINGGTSQFRRMTGMPMILSPGVLSVVPEIMAPYRARCNGLLNNRNASPTVVQSTIIIFLTVRAVRGPLWRRGSVHCP